MMKNRIIRIMILAVLIGTAWQGNGAWAATTPSVKELYRQLDQAIAHTDDYVKVRQERIGKAILRLKQCRSAQKKYEASFALYEEYRSYKNDSALHYLTQCIALAEQAHDVKAEGNAKALLAFQSSTTGKYNESYSILTQMDTTLLDAQGRRNYLIACQHLYGELSYYSHLPKLHKYYESKAQEFSKLLEKELNPNDDYSLQVKEVACRKGGKFKQAFQINDLRMKKAKEGSHQYSIVCFYRAMIYKDSGDMDNAMVWLLKSALCDVKLAVMDQGSLWEIANYLGQNPEELDRSYSYIKFAWKAANTFNTAMRSGQIMPVLASIEDSYQKQLSASNRRLKVMIGVSVLLIVIVLCLLYFVNTQRKRLAVAHDDLEKSNEELKAANISLYESSKMKEVYIGRFLRLTAAYRDKLETMRKRVTKLVKSREFVKLNAFLQPNDEDTDEFYEYFDSAFLKLFPNFVHDFNELLRPEERIVLTDENKLTTAIRIFALIRLGIEDSSKIAEFLHYSVNTIYNYRAKVKNGALCDRDAFEDNVKMIGMK